MYIVKKLENLATHSSCVSAVKRERQWRGILDKANQRKDVTIASFSMQKGQAQLPKILPLLP